MTGLTDSISNISPEFNFVDEPCLDRFSISFNSFAHGRPNMGPQDGSLRGTCVYWLL